MKLSRKFYQQETETVAKLLLGKTLVHKMGKKMISGYITETEAYLGAIDRACHTYGGKQTKRVQSMYLEGGHSYIYFIYGMYYCFNVVTRTTQHPEAVLIRSLEPLSGIEIMQKNRNQQNLKNLTTGPGKLCQALHLTKKQDGLDLCGSEVFIEEGISIPKKDIFSTTRIGVNYAGQHAHWPLRFYIKNNFYVSKIVKEQ